MENASRREGEFAGPPKRALLRRLLFHHKDAVRLGLLALSFAGVIALAVYRRSFGHVITTGDIFLMMIPLGLASYFGAEFLASLYVMPALKAKGFNEVPPQDLNQMLRVFEPDKLLLLPPWEEFMALPGANPANQTRSIKRVLATVFYGPEAMLESLQSRGYDQLSLEEVWMLIELYGNLPLLELPEWRLLVIYPGVNADDQRETIKTILATAKPVVRHSFYTLDGKKVEPRHAAGGEIPDLSKNNDAP